MKIKVIDLLTKYANEGLTKIKVRYDNSTYVWDEKDFLYDVYKEFGERKNSEIIEFLNDEVEIIEEPKKIERLDIDFKKFDDEIVYLEFESKINELIDEINKSKEK